MRTPSHPVSELARAVNRSLERHGVRSPGTTVLARLFQTVYLTTLKTEEGAPLQMRVALIDPRNPDPDAPRNPRPDHWMITRLERPLPLTVSNLAKLSRAADPWNSSLAVHYDARGQFFVWGLVDQTIHFNAILVREADSGYAPPGTIQVAATGPATLTVYREMGFIARLAQDKLLKRQNDVFYSGPILGQLGPGIEKYIRKVQRRLGSNRTKLVSDYRNWLQRKWVDTLCRLLIGIQRCRHGGALLIARRTKDLHVKYSINYERLPKALTDLAVATIQSDLLSDRICSNYLEPSKDSLPVALYLDESVTDGDRGDCEKEVTGCVRFISSLSGVDGLILVAPDLIVQGFGGEVLTKHDPDPVYLSEDTRARERDLSPVDPTHFGMRHRSMMRYCFAHPGSVGFVVSQDGEVRALTRLRDRLIMWENLKILSFWGLVPRRPRKLKRR